MTGEACGHSAYDGKGLCGRLHGPHRRHRGAIRHIENIHKYIRPEDVPEHTMFIITTDGLENASRRYDSASVKR